MTHRALVLSAVGKPPSLETVPRLTPRAGEVVVRVLAASLFPSMLDVFQVEKPYPVSLPMIPGQGAIARVESVGEDATILAPGQLVLCDVFVHSRDDPNVVLLQGWHRGQHPQGKKLMDEVWRHASFAEYAKFPLENVFQLDEEMLLKRKGYSLSDLCWLNTCLVPFGGLADIQVMAGESVVIAPATGWFGGAAVQTALAMGANVIAAGRNQASLQKLLDHLGQSGRLQIVVLTGDVDTDEVAMRKAAPRRGVDAFIDLSPPQAAATTHIAAAVKSLRPYGRCALMGGIKEDVSFSYTQIMHQNLRIHGRQMYTREDILRLIQMAEMGNLKLGKETGVVPSGPFRLDQIDEAVAELSKQSGWGGLVVLSP